MKLDQEAIKVKGCLQIYHTFNDVILQVVIDASWELY